MQRKVKNTLKREEKNKNKKYRKVKIKIHKIRIKRQRYDLYIKHSSNITI